MSDQTQQGQNQQAQRKLHILKNSKISLSAPLPNHKGVYAKLSYDAYEGNPRIVVNTKDPAQADNRDTNRGRIEAAMEPTAFWVFLDNLEKASRAKEQFKEVVECKGHKRINGQKDKEVSLISSVIVGKDAEGHVYISLNSSNPDLAKIKFIFGISDQRYHSFIHGDGTPWTKAEISVVAARAHHNLLSIAMPVLMQDQMKEVVMRPFTGGGGNNNWKPKQGGYGGGGYNGGGNNWKPRQQQQHQGGGASEESFASAADKTMDSFEDDSLPF